MTRSWFERVMFASLVPALTLPIVAGTLALWVQPGPKDPDSNLGHLISGPMFGVFMVVLLGSMSLNAWLLIRQPANLRSGSVPRLPGWALTLLYLTVAAWIVMLFLVHLNSSVLSYLALALVVESIAVFVLILATRRATPATFTETGLAPLVRWGLLAYLVIALAEVTTGILLVARPPSSDWLPYWLPVIIALGLPWSPGALLAVVTALAARFTLGIQTTPSESAVPVEIALMMLPVLFNIGLATGVLASPQSRAMALRLLFFRGTERPTTD